MNRITRLIPLHEEGCPGAHGGTCDCIVEHPGARQCQTTSFGQLLEAIKTSTRDDLNRHKLSREAKPSRTASGDLSNFWRR